MPDLTCQSCGAGFPDTELFCPSCGTAVIPQLSTAEVGKLTSPHKEMPGVVRRGSLLGLVIGIALAGSALLFYWPEDPEVERTYLPTLAAIVLLGLLAGTVAGFVIHRRRAANEKN
jgi:hypothetical protein